MIFLEINLVSGGTKIGWITRMFQNLKMKLWCLVLMQ